MSEFSLGDIVHIVWHTGYPNRINGKIVAVTDKHYIIKITSSSVIVAINLRYDKVTGHMITKVKGVLSYINNIPK